MTIIDLLEIAKAQFPLGKKIRLGNGAELSPSITVADNGFIVLLDAKNVNNGLAGDELQWVSAEIKVADSPEVKKIETAEKARRYLHTEFEKEAANIVEFMRKNGVEAQKPEPEARVVEVKTPVLPPVKSKRKPVKRKAKEPAHAA